MYLPRRHRRRPVLTAASLATIFLLLLLSGRFRSPSSAVTARLPHRPPREPKPSGAAWEPPPIKDPFPSLATATPPPIPAWNKAEGNVHEQYGIPYAPPLLIGFTRAWPLLLQVVVSYINAGWPPGQIYVVENTGTLRSNAQGLLSLQNPFFLDHAHLARLGVNVITTPVLMTFSQLQNFYIHFAQQRDWPWYFWSHMDLLVFAFEDGDEKYPAEAGEPGYKSLYERCLDELSINLKDEANPRWSIVFFAYDNLALVNRESYEDVGGWDVFIPFYTNDCDMHSRLAMKNWTTRDAVAGHILDVSSVLDDLRVLYRDHSIEPTFTDPNPPRPPPPVYPAPPAAPGAEVAGTDGAASKAKRAPTYQDLAYFRKLLKVGRQMSDYKLGYRGRNTWQLGQRGGQGEPFYYPSRGIAEGMKALTTAGRYVFKKKWNNGSCDTVDRRRWEDQWAA